MVVEAYSGSGIEVGLAWAGQILHGPSSGYKEVHRLPNPPEQEQDREFGVGSCSHPAKEEREVVYANGARVLTVGCVEERVKILKKSGSYCRMCYQKQDKSLSHERQRMHCKTSTMGCPQCNEPICKHCWEEGYDMHVKK